MGKNLLLASWGRGLGHITRCLAIGVEAKRQGWNVTVLTEPRLSSFVDQAACALAPLPSKLTDGGFWDKWNQVEYVQQSIDTDLALIEWLKADAVIHDVRPSMPVACAVAGVPDFCIMQCQNHLSFALTDEYKPQMWVKSISAFNEILKNYNLVPVREDLRELYRWGTALVPSAPEFDPVMLDGEESLCYVGPLLWDGGLRKDVLLDHNERQLVFVYGVIQSEEDLYRLVDAFRDSRYYLIITALPEHIRVLGLESAISWASIHQFVPASSILPRCAAAIIHGGHGACMSSASSGTPALVLPRDEPERIFNGRRLEAVRMAKCNPGTILWPALPAEVDQLVSEWSYRAYAQEVSHRLLQLKGPEAVVHLLTASVS